MNIQISSPNSRYQSGKPLIVYQEDKVGEPQFLQIKEQETEDNRPKKIELLTFLNGIYQGHVDKNNQINGIGCYFWKDSQFYYGQWRNNLMEGQGIMVFPQGGYMYGYLTQNLMHGKIKLVFPNQDFMFGSCNHGLFEGKFLRAFKDAGRYIECYYERGNLIKIEKDLTLDQFNSQVVKEFTELNNMKEFLSNSVFYNFKKDCTITTQNQDNDDLSNIYDEFNNQMKCIELSHHELYLGVAKLSSPRGLGVKINLHINQIQRGRFLDGILNGRGRKNFQNGDIYDGGFTLGKLSNSGLFYNNQELNYYRGYFEDGKLITLFSQSTSPFPPSLCEYELNDRQEVDIKREIHSQIIYFTEKEGLYMIKSLHQLGHQISITQEMQEKEPQEEKSDTIQHNQMKKIQQNNNYNTIKITQHPEIISEEMKKSQSSSNLFSSYQNTQIEKVHLPNISKTNSLQKIQIISQIPKPTILQSNSKAVKSTLPPLSRKGSTQDNLNTISQSVSNSALNSTYPLTSQYNSNSNQTFKQFNNNFSTLSEYNSNKLDGQQGNNNNNNNNMNGQSKEYYSNTSNNTNNTSTGYPNIFMNEQKQSSKDSLLENKLQEQQEEVVDIQQVNSLQFRKQNYEQDIQYKQFQGDIEYTEMMVTENGSLSCNLSQLPDFDQKRSVYIEDQQNSKLTTHLNEKCDDLKLPSSSSCSVITQKQQETSVIVLDTGRISKSSNEASSSLAKTPNFLPDNQQLNDSEQINLANCQDQSSDLTANRVSIFNTNLKPFSFNSLQKDGIHENFASFSKIEEIKPDSPTEIYSLRNQFYPFSTEEDQSLNNTNQFQKAQNNLQEIDENKLHQHSVWMEDFTNSNKSPSQLFKQYKKTLQTQQDDIQSEHQLTLQVEEEQCLDNKKSMEPQQYCILEGVPSHLRYNHEKGNTNTFSISQNYETLQQNEIQDQESLESETKQNGTFPTVVFNNSNTYMENDGEYIEEENTKSAQRHNYQSGEMGNQYKQEFTQKLKQIVQQNSQFQQQLQNSNQNQQITTTQSENQIQETNFTTDQSCSIQQQFQQRYSNQHNFLFQNVNCSNNFSFNFDKRFSFCNQSDRNTLNLTIAQFQQMASPQNDYRDNNLQFNHQQFQDISPIKQAGFDNKENKPESHLNAQQYMNSLKPPGNNVNMKPIKRTQQPRVIKIDLLQELSTQNNINEQQVYYQYCSPQSKQNASNELSNYQTTSYEKSAATQQSAYIYRDVSKRLLQDICLDYESSQTSTNNCSKTSNKMFRHRRHLSENSKQNQGKFYKTQQQTPVQNRLNSETKYQRQSSYLSRKQSNSSLIQAIQQKKMMTSKSSSTLIRQYSLGEFSQFKRQSFESSTKKLKTITNQQYVPNKTLFQKLLEFKQIHKKTTHAM